MGHHAFVDNDGNELQSYDIYKQYKKDHHVEPLNSSAVYTDEDNKAHNVFITTTQSCLVHGFKTVITCLEDEDCKYHGLIRECDGETDSATQHERIVALIIDGLDIPESEEN